MLLLHLVEEQSHQVLIHSPAPRTRPRDFSLLSVVWKGVQGHWDPRQDIQTFLKQWKTLGHQEGKDVLWII